MAQLRRFALDAFPEYGKRLFAYGLGVASGSKTTRSTGDFCAARAERFREIGGYTSSGAGWGVALDGSMIPRVVAFALVVAVIACGDYVCTLVGCQTGLFVQFDRALTASQW